MRKTLIMLLASVLVAGTVLVPASGHVRDIDGCPYHIDETSADKPNAIDLTGDWAGPVLGDGSASLGDVYREGTDLTKAWMTRDNATGKVQGVIEVVSLANLQPNTIFYLLWTFASDPTDPKARRWVSARLKADPLLPSVFTYGHQGMLVTGTGFITEGDTTGSIVPGAPGRIVIDVPLASLGNPQYGDTLFDFLAEARVLVGSPEPLPQPPSPIRHGFVFLADDTNNYEGVKCDAIVNDPATDPSP